MIDSTKDMIEMPWLDIIAVVSVFVAILYAIAYFVDTCREVRRIIEVGKSHVWEMRQNRLSSKRSKK
jgi:hypothetical protein